MNQINLNDVLERLKTLLKVRKKGDVADALGITIQAINRWEKRGVLPYQKIINLSIQNGWSIDFVLLGETVVETVVEIDENALHQTLQMVQPGLQDFPLKKQAQIISSLYKTLIEN